MGAQTRNAEVSRAVRCTWGVSFVLLSVAAGIVPDVQNRMELAGLFLAMLPVQLLWNRILPLGRVIVIRLVHDSLICLTVVLLSPSMWFPTIIVYVMGAGNMGLKGLPKLSKVVLLSTLFGLALVGALNRQPTWLATVLGLGFMLSMRLFVVDSIWRRVENAEDQLDEMLDSVSAVLHTSDPYSGKVTWVSRNIQRVTGWTAQEWMKEDQRTMLHPDDRELFWIPLTSMRLGDEYERYARHRHRDGRWIWLSVNSLVVLGEDGRLQMRGHYTDASELVAAQKEITALAQTDTVTGLANRHVLMAELRSRLEGGRPFGLLMLDVDRFKEINDTLGHEFGDDVLRELARRLTSGVANRLVCRLGGDEFAVVIDNPDHVTLLAEDVGATCAEPMRFGSLTVSTQVSIGTVIAPNDGDSTEDLLRRVDIAMYLAKRRHQVHVQFQPEMEQTSAVELQLSATVGEAIEAGEFEVFFQPKVNLLNREVVGAEGLVRWRNPEHGLLAPKAFIHLVRLSNANGAFTDAVVEQAVAFAARTKVTTGETLPVAVNIMVSSLFDEEFPSRVAAMLRRHEVPAVKLTLEVTEDDIMEEHASASPVIAELAALGVRLSIDDFGTGYSSLSRLVDLPVTEIKIDRRFVTGVRRQRQERAVIESIVLLAGRLGLDVVAEGIEGVSEVELLTAFGCFVGQGFLYSPAVPADELLNKLSVSRVWGATSNALEAEVISLFPDVAHASPAH